MGLADLPDVFPPYEGDQYECINDGITSLIEGEVKRNKSDRGYTYYFGMVRRGRAFVTIQPNIWIYVDPSVRTGVTASHSPDIVIESSTFEPVPANEKWGNSFGHRAPFTLGPDCELPEELRLGIIKSYHQVRRSF